jgi:hypothetical protein
MADARGVLCRYFFQETLVEQPGVPLEPQTASLLLSGRPTLAELRRRFPFEGQHHFRLQLTPAAGRPYCWLDLLEPGRELPVGRRGEILVKVLQLSPERQEDADDADERVDVREDLQFAAFFRAQQQQQQQARKAAAEREGGASAQATDAAGVLLGVKKALASKMKQSSVAQSIQKQSARMWEKVVVTVAAAGTSGGNAPPTAAALEQLAKLVGAMKQPLHEGSREHVDLLQRLWASCFDAEPFELSGPAWERLGFRYGDPLRELQSLLALQCLVFFLEVHRAFALPILSDAAANRGPVTFSFALVGAQIAFVLADLLQLKDGGCLGAERPFWRLFEDPIAFYELYSVMFRAFDASWKLHSEQTTEVRAHLNYAADFAQELLRRGPASVADVIDSAYQLQNW